MREFRYYTESEPGLFLRRSEADTITPDAMRRHGQAMRGHFLRLFARPECAPLTARHYQTIISLGGGHPHLEATLHPDQIIVSDPLYDPYSQLADTYRDTRPDAPPTTWRHCGRTFDPDAIQGGDCNVFCHVLEHMSLTKAASYLQAVAPDSDIIIYGPNADHFSADTWWHAVPVHEHLWLAGLQWTQTWAEQITDRPAAIAIDHDQDLLIWLPRPSETLSSPSTGRANP